MIDAMQRRVRAYRETLPGTQEDLDNEAALYVEHLNYQSREVPDVHVTTDDGGAAVVNHWGNA